MGMMAPCNIKCKMCAFCKYWYDPTNSAIAPKAPEIGVWLYDKKARCQCLQWGVTKAAGASCKKYECKI